MKQLRPCRLVAVIRFRMLAALLILLVMVAVAVVLNPSRADFRWFMQLRRPGWLTFERWIPLIWLLIYACFYGSALLAWNAGRNLSLLAGYALLLVLVQAYTLVICRSRSLRNGTLLAMAGWLWGAALTVMVASQSRAAGFLLIPYLLWSPVGTVVTWQMQRLNR